MPKQYEFANKDHDPLVSLEGLQAYDSQIKNALADKETVESLRVRITDLENSLVQLTGILSQLAEELEGIA